jgi:hypothetical protein
MGVVANITHETPQAQGPIFNNRRCHLMRCGDANVDAVQPFVIV